MHTTLTGFDLERLRKKFLAEHKWPQLLQTYSPRWPEIPGDNTPDFWDYKFRGDNTTQFPMALKRNTLVASSIIQGSRVLNLGAGKGYLERIVADRLGSEVTWTGTDFTHQTIQELTQSFPQFTFKKTGLLRLPFKDNQFDVVCLLEVIEHISPSETFVVLGELYRVLKKGGTAIVSVPLNEGLEAMMPANPNAHKRVYSSELLQFELQHVGLKVQRLQTLSAFATYYQVKHWLNSLFNLRQPNNVIIWAKK